MSTTTDRGRRWTVAGDGLRCLSCRLAVRVVEGRQKHPEVVVVDHIRRLLVVVVRRGLYRRTDLALRRTYSKEQLQAGARGRRLGGVEVLVVVE